MNHSLKIRVSKEKCNGGVLACTEMEAPMDEYEKLANAIILQAVKDYRAPSSA